LLEIKKRQICNSLIIKCQSKSLIIKDHSKLVAKQFKMPIDNHHFRSILVYQLFMLIDRQRLKDRNGPFNQTCCPPFAPFRICFSFAVTNTGFGRSSDDD
jgi:hypothetical protein